jgi:hypothetical protein
MAGRSSICCCTERHGRGESALMQPSPCADRMWSDSILALSLGTTGIDKQRLADHPLRFRVRHHLHSSSSTCGLHSPPPGPQGGLAERGNTQRRGRRVTSRCPSPRASTARRKARLVQVVISTNLIAAEPCSHATAGARLLSLLRLLCRCRPRQTWIPC